MSDASSNAAAEDAEIMATSTARSPEDQALLDAAIAAEAAKTAYYAANPKSPPKAS